MSKKKKTKITGILGKDAMPKLAELLGIDKNQIFISMNISAGHEDWVEVTTTVLATRKTHE